MSGASAKCKIGPGVLVTSDDIRVLRRKDNFVSATRGPHNDNVSAIFSDAKAAKQHFDLVALDLQKTHRLVLIGDDMLIARDHVRTMYHKAIFEDHKYIRQEAIIVFDTGLAWNVPFATEVMAVAWLDKAIEKIQTE